MRVVLIWFFSVFSVFFGFLSAEALELVSFSQETEKYGLFTAKFRTSYVKEDPDDPRNIDLTVVFVSPSGEVSEVPAFCLSNSRSEKVSLWEVRFTPEEEGEFSFSANAALRRRNVFREFSGARFNVKSSTIKGFLEKSPNNPNYLKFSSGEPFFGIGHNVAWVYNSNPEIFGRYFSLLKEAGCNITRVWICDWSLPLESGKTGNYNRSSSEKIDRILELAERNGIYIMLCLDTYGSLMEESGMWREGKWGLNPYNVKNGGPCKKPEDFFTNKEAVRLYKNKLRYVLSRWGYSPNILAFEIWNEYNSPPEWTKEMASYLKSMGRSRKLVTTSLGYPREKVFDESSIWKIDEIDIVTHHFYGNGTEPQLVNNLFQKSRELKSGYEKPFIISEFGIDFSRNDKDYDIRGEGKALHNSIWASVFSGAAASAMNWWHDTYIRPKDLYRHYSALSKFLEGVNWDSGKIMFPEVSLVFYRAGDLKGGKARDVVIRPLDIWTVSGTSEFEVLGNGDLSKGGLPFKYLHGSEKKDMIIDQIYKVEYPEEGGFVIRVGTVSQGGHLNVFVNDVKVLDRVCPAGPGKGPWKRSRFLEKYNVYQCVYDEDIFVPVPAGKHAIRLSNTGEDWIGIDKITLKNYAAPDIADARCLSINIGGTLMFWVQNRDSNWMTAYEGRKPHSIKGAYFEVYDLSENSYILEIWDTYSGKIISSKKAEPSFGKLRVTLPEFHTDLALKLTPSKKRLDRNGGKM
ncbi:MAG: cellulase family glycosylhydrolase [Candidatus Omnitrophota bacterium]